MESASEVSLVIAGGAGVISFLSPCVLPLVPSYMVYIAGVPLSDLQGGSADKGVRGRILLNSVEFITGFSLSGSGGCSDPNLDQERWTV